MSATSSRRFGWWLNLDADFELARPAGYRPRRRLLEQMRDRGELLSLLTLDEPVISEAPAPVDLVFCWSPTPSALGACRSADLRTAPAPALEVLQRVNHRSFVLDLPGGLAPRRFVQRRHELDELLRDHAPTRRWRAKRAFGFAGKGQRRLELPPRPDDERWITDSLARGGLLLEPEVALAEELCLHGYVDRSAFELGAVCSQRCDDRGALRTIEPAHDVPPTWERELRRTAELAAAALLAAGYFGPFGLDAYAWRGPRGIELNPLGELNARFTVGWSVGFGPRRRDVLERYAVASVP